MTRKRVLGAAWFATPGLIALGSFVGWLVAAWRIPTPQVLPDEVIYATSAKRIADFAGLLPAGQPPNFLYSFLIAPAWRLQSMGATYGLVKVENALLVTLAGVFVYLWARRLVARPYAIVALALTLLLPALNLSMTVMTENAVYPCFALALFAIALALERPTLIRQGLVLLALALVVLARVQELVLVPAVVLAVAIKLTLDRRAGASSRGETRRQLRLAGVLLIGGLAYALVRMGEGRSLTGSLGGYQGVLHGTYSFTDVVQWTLWQAGELVIAVAFIPVAAFILVAVRFACDRSTARAERAFVAISVPAAVLLVGEVGAFGAGGFSGPWIIERYTFYAAPIFFLGFAIWLGRGLPRPSALTALALAAPAALLLSLPLEDKVGPTLSANILTLAALRRLSEQHAAQKSG